MTINNIKAYVYLNQAFAVVGYGESDKEAIEDALQHLHCDNKNVCTIKIVQVIGNESAVQYYTTVKALP